MSRFSIQVQDSNWPEARTFHAGTGLDFGLSERALLECVPQPPSHRTFDLLRIASSVFFADRIVKRKRRGGPASWPRQMKLSIEVSEPEFWKDQSNYDQLIDVLSFVSGGAAVADGFGASQLEMYESGVGAINAPLLAGMDGSQATRSAHPHFLHQVSQLLSKVLDRDIEVVLPFFNSTKGELVRSLSQSDLQHLAKATCSCPSYPVRVQKSGPQQSCGVCAACLFRRVAMNSAGIEEEASAYQYDFLNSKADIPNRKLRCLAAFLNQIDSLVGVERGELPLCIERHLRQTHVIDRTKTVQPIIDLYRRYRVEWTEMIRRAESIGCKWTKMIDLPPQAA